MPRTVAIIQARMGSRRLPGKVLMDLAGKPLLRHVIDRTRQAAMPDEVVVATCLGDGSEAIVERCRRWGVACYSDRHGWDVLRRFLGAAEAYDAEWIVRVCADNPLLVPEWIDALVEAALADRFDYTAYELSPGVPAITRPTGYFAEVTTREALERAERMMAPNDPRREHVTACLYAEAWRFRCRWLPVPEAYRLDPPPSASIDTAEDFRRVERMVEESKDEAIAAN